MALSINTNAPSFSLYDDQQNLIRLDDFDKHILLLFFPGAFTSVCTNEMVAVSHDIDQYVDLGIQVFGISTDSPFVLSEFRQQNDIQFSLLSDHNADVAADYEAKYSHNFTAMNLDRIAKRAAYIVGPSNKIKYAEVLENAGKQPDFAAIKGLDL